MIDREAPLWRLFFSVFHLLSTFMGQTQKNAAKWLLPAVCALAWSAAWYIHYITGFHVEAFLFISQVVLFSVCVLGIRYCPPKWVFIYTGAVVALVFIRPSHHLLFTLDIIPAALYFLVFCSLGMSLHRQPKWRMAFAIAFLVALPINLFAAIVQWFDWEDSFSHLLLHSPLGMGDRSIGNIGQANQLGMFFLLCVLAIERVAAHRALPHERTNHQTPSLSFFYRSDAWCLLLVLAATTGIVTTQSRIVLVCACCLAVAAWWTRRARRGFWNVILIGLPALILLVDAGRTSLHGFLMLQDTATASMHSIQATRMLSSENPRASMWQHVAWMIEQRPWLGWGWRETRYAQIDSMAPNPHFELIDHAHNLFLELAVSFGIPITMLVIALLGYAVYRFKPWRETDGNRITAWIVLGFLFVYSMVEFPLWYLRFMSIAGLAVGYLCAPYALGAKRRLLSTDQKVLTPQPCRPSWRARSLGMFLILGCTSAIFVDYQWASQAYNTSLFWRVGSEGSMPHIIASQRTVLFGPYTAFAIASSDANQHLTDQQLIYYGEQALHISPEPSLMTPLIAAHQRVGNKERAYYLAQRLARAFPENGKMIVRLPASRQSP
jgi:O-antigen ligase